VWIWSPQVQTWSTPAAAFRFNFRETTWPTGRYVHCCEAQNRLCVSAERACSGWVLKWIKGVIVAFSSLKIDNVCLYLRNNYHEPMQHVGVVWTFVSAQLLQLHKCLIDLEQNKKQDSRIKMFWDSRSGGAFSPCHFSRICRQRWTKIGRPVRRFETQTMECGEQQKIRAATQFFQWRIFGNWYRKTWLLL
jgi:hypothetical protein